MMPLEASHRVVAERVGLQRETIRKIRFGMINADVAPELPRCDKATFQRTCPKCQHWGAQRCTLGFPEAIEVHYARGCGAFADAA